MSPCPHCGGTTVIERHRALRWTCAACGGPVVPADVPGLTRSNAELASLVRAKRARAAAFGWTAATILLAVTTLMTFGLGALLFLVAKLPAIILTVFGIVQALLAMGTRARWRANDQEAQRDLDAAWESVADEVVNAGGAVTAKALAAKMRTTEEHAETLLTALSVKDRVRVEVTDDAELHYSRPPQVRVAEDAEVPEEEAAPEKRARS